MGLQQDLGTGSIATGSHLALGEHTDLEPPPSIGGRLCWHGVTSPSWRTRAPIHSTSRSTPSSCARPLITAPSASSGVVPSEHAVMASGTASTRPRSRRRCESLALAVQSLSEWGSSALTPYGARKVPTPNDRGHDLRSRHFTANASLQVAWNWVTLPSSTLAVWEMTSTP